MAKRLKDDEYGSIITKLEKWESSYCLHSEGKYYDEYFCENLELFARVIFSEHKRIVKDDLIRFYIVIEHDMKNSIKPPKYVSSFDRSKKCRTAYLTVHKSFIDNFRFLINNGIMPYLAVSYLNRKQEKDIMITSFDMETNVIIDDYRTR